MAEEVGALRVSLGLDSADFSRSIGDINRKLKGVESEFKATSAGVAGFGNSLDDLKVIQDKLSRQYDLHSTKVQELKKQYEQSVQVKGKDAKETENLLIRYNKAVAEMNKTKSSLESVNSQIDTQSSKWSKLQNSLSATSEKFNAVGEKMKQAGMTITAIGGAIAGGLGLAVKAAADNETQFAKMETAMQGNTKAAKEYLEWSKEFGKTTPFEAADVVDATIKLKSYGIEAKDTLTSIGNMAAGMGKGLDQAVEAVADAQTGELERLKEFGITKQMLIDKALELGKGEIVNAKGQITDMASLNDALFAIMDERFKGGMERQSKTLNGQMSALKDSFTQILASLGEALMPIVEKVTGFLQKLADWFNNLSPSMQSFIAIATAVAGAVALIGGPLLMLIGFIPQIITGFTALAPVFAALTAPIGLTVAAIAGLIAILVAAYKNSESFREIVNKSFEAIKTVILTVMEAVSSFIREKLDQIKQFWNENGEQIKQALQNVWNFIKPFVENQLNTMKIVFETVLKVISTIFKTTWENIKIVVDTVLKAIGGLIKFWSQVLTGDWNGALNTLKNTTSTILDAIKNIFSNSWNGIKNVTQSVWNGIKQSITEPIETAKNTLIGIIDKIKSAFSNLKITIPKPKLPHINVDWNSFGIGDAKVKVPKFDIDWYKTGGVFNKPVIMGNAGFGDVSEAIVPFEGSHAKRIAGLIANEMPDKNTINFNPVMNFHVNGNLDENQANKYADYTIDRMMERLKPFGFEV